MSFVKTIKKAASLIFAVFDFRWCARATNIKLDENLTDEIFFNVKIS